jgi:hypothetical protein
MAIYACEDHSFVVVWESARIGRGNCPACEMVSEIDRLEKQVADLEEAAATIGVAKNGA